MAPNHSIDRTSNSRLRRLLALMQTSGRIEQVLRTVRAFIVSALTFAQLTPGSALAADRWFLLARHGECSSMRSLERRFPDLGNIAEPEAFIQFVLTKGLKVSSKSMPVRAGSALEVLVPEKDLSLLFVTAELCSKVEVR